MIKKIIDKLLRISDEGQKKYLIAHGLKVGRNARIYSWWGIDQSCPWLITIGDDVIISRDVHILAHDVSSQIVDCHSKIGLVNIGNNVFIGCGSIILCNVNIGNNVVIGAGSVVTHDVPSNSVVAGNPARVITTIEQYKNKNREKLDEKHYFDQMYWHEWIESDTKQKQYMVNELKNNGGYGYLKSIKESQRMNETP